MAQGWRSTRLSGEQQLAVAALLLIGLVTVAALVIAVVRPDATGTTVALTASSITAMSSLVRRHDIQDQVSSPGNGVPLKMPSSAIPDMPVVTKENDLP
jgi:hypothetical protein